MAFNKVRKRLDYASDYHEYYKIQHSVYCQIHTHTYVTNRAEKKPDKICMHIEIDNAGKPRERKLRQEIILTFFLIILSLSVGFILENI